jgi:hypothetical protein
MERFGRHSHDHLPLSRTEKRASLSHSRASIPEMRQKCDRFQAFLGAFSTYLGEQVAESDEEERWKTEKEFLPTPRHNM